MAPVSPHPLVKGRPGHIQTRIGRRPAKPSHPTRTRSVPEPERNFQLFRRDADRNICGSLSQMLREEKLRDRESTANLLLSVTTRRFLKYAYTGISSSSSEGVGGREKALVGSSNETFLQVRRLMHAGVLLGGWRCHAAGTSHFALCFVSPFREISLVVCFTRVVAEEACEASCVH